MRSFNSLMMGPRLEVGWRNLLMDENDVLKF